MRIHRRSERHRDHIELQREVALKVTDNSYLNNGKVGIRANHVQVSVRGFPVVALEKALVNPAAASAGSTACENRWKSYRVPAVAPDNVSSTSFRTFRLC